MTSYFAAPLFPFQKATSLPLNSLGSLGHHVSPSKTQVCSPSVLYLGVQLSPGSKTFTSNGVQTLKDLQPPTTVDQILPFLGLMGFFHYWIPNVAITAKPLYQVAKETPKGPFTHLAMVCSHFPLLWDTVLTPPALVLPDSTQHYHVYMDEKMGVATVALPHPVRPSHWAVHFFIQTAGLTKFRWQPCMRTLAEASEIT